MEYIKILQDNSCKITMHGKFTFADHGEFKKILNFTNENTIEALELELSAVEFVDSAALGLLLLLRDETKKKSIHLTFIKPQGQVQKMFEISKFYDLFEIVG